MNALSPVGGRAVLAPRRPCSLAAGGAKTTITYAAGHEEADALAACDKPSPGASAAPRATSTSAPCPVSWSLTSTGHLTRSTISPRRRSPVSALQAYDAGALCRVLRLLRRMVSGRCCPR
ncbi:hypothetical protein ACRAWD_04355 [Caulobacter segnis]